MIRKYGLIREKVQQIASQRNAVYRGNYIAEISMYNANMLVFADETGKDTRDCIRRFGYAVQGQTPQSSLRLTRGERTSVIAAISHTGIVGYETFTGTVKDDEFFDFVRGVLIPNMMEPVRILF